MPARPPQLHKSSKPLLKDAFMAVFGDSTGLVDMLTEHVPSARLGTAHKVQRTWTGDQKSDMAQNMSLCNARGPLVVAVAKMVPRLNDPGFDAFGRVISGALRPGEAVRVLGESYSPEDEEDSAVAQVGSAGQCGAHGARVRVREVA